MSDPTVVAREHESEAGREARRSIYTNVGGPDPLVAEKAE